MQLYKVFIYCYNLSCFCHLSSLQFIHSIGMCTMRRFLAVLRSFFHSSLLCTFSCHPSAATILPSSFTSSCHLFLGLLVNLFVPKLIHNTLLGILFPSILFTCPKQLNLFNLIVFIIQDESLARGPKLLFMYTVEQRGVLVLKYWQTGSFKACRRHFERNLVKDVHHRNVASRNWLKS